MKNKQTVLIVDDIADNLNVAAQTLMENEINVILALSGKEAVISAEKFLPDLILLDIMMPEMNGYEVCEVLKNHKQTKDIPIIFLSAINETRNIVKGFELGAVDYINKPFIQEELISRVQTHLKIYNQNLELKNKEKDLKESEAKLQAVINSIPDFIFYKDIESRYTGVNKAYAKHIKNSPENIIGKTDFDLFDKKEANIFLESDKKTIQTNVDLVYEEWTQDFSGKNIYLDTRKTPLINSEDKTIGIVGVSRNITELKYAEETLKANEEKLQNIYDNANEGIFVLQNDKIVFLNNKLSEILAYNKDELQKHPFLEFVHKEDLKETAVYYQKKITGEKIGKAIIFRIIDANDNIKYVKINSKQIIWEGNNAILGMLDDITEQHHLEDEIKLKNAEIKQKHENILAGIRYAKTIQTSLLPEKSVTNNILKNNFILYKPKDIVSGDFYYINKIDNNIFFSVADCTGHGIPGGFLTMLGINIIHGIIKHQKIKEPAKILNLLRNRIKDIFKGVEKNNTNGIDIAFCSVNTETNVLQYAGAFNPLWIYRDDELIELKANRNPIGYYPVEKDFTNHTIQLQNKDKIYLFSDGFKDQIGGKGIQKYNNKRFKELFVTNAGLSMKKQKTIFTKELEKWQADNEQIDDITIMGIEWEM